ncbi:MAG: SDR family NAD(P)-dependent oxidoreductase [Candidatus Dormibacteria bacterium]
MRIVITGGAGFIGANLARRHLGAGDEVVVLDNLARAGSEVNARWLESGPGRLTMIRGDVRDQAQVREAVRGADQVYHLAGQVAVTTSVSDPRTDFEVNALGSFNVIDAVRTEAPGAVALYSSTNKVYGGMEEVGVALRGERYAYTTLASGVPETQPLDFHSPYGCSKGAGDQYFRDFARIYNLRTVVLRQSCIYGQRQMGNEDQGWVAHFAIQALKGRPITIFGDGRQVRDVLHVDDLLDCFAAATAQAQAGEAMVLNIGGGPGNVLSLLDLVAHLEQSLSTRLDITYTGWRPGDQRVYISDISRAASAIGWEPRLDVRAGLDRLVGWLRENLDALP